jgi:hypothetical protein
MWDFDFDPWGIDRATHFVCVILSKAKDLLFLTPQNESGWLVAQGSSWG